MSIYLEILLSNISFFLNRKKHFLQFTNKEYNIINKANNTSALVGQNSSRSNNTHILKQLSKKPEILHI